MTDNLPKRTLVGEVLITQFGYAAIVGIISTVLALLSAAWIVEENTSEWAQRWIDDLDAMSIGLNDTQASDNSIIVDDYMAKFPELKYVRFYAPQGSVTFQAFVDHSQTIVELSDVELTAAQAQVSAYTIEHPHEPYRRLVKAITVREYGSTLFEAESLDDVQTTETLTGFIEIGIDYDHYNDQLWGYARRNALFIALLFLVLTLFGRVMLRRALKPLQDIQAPLISLAEGNTDVVIGTSQHREIAEITEGLRRAAEGLKQRDRFLSHLAHHDALTGLPNRFSFSSELADVLRRAEPAAVLVVNLDRFKVANDTHGRAVGDEVLQQVANRLTNITHEATYVARLDGDEFGIILTSPDADQHLRLAEEILSSITARPLSSAHPTSITCSIGIALLHDTFTPDQNDVIAWADIACRQAKAAGGDRFRIYQPDQGVLDQIKWDSDWSQRIRHALRNNEFVLHYQPISIIDNGAISHFECLLRLKDGETIHPPGAFLPAAIRFGLMVQIDRWVIATAFNNLAWFQRKNPEICFTINLSGSSFDEGGLVEFVEQQLTQHDVTPGSIIFEVTEQVAVESIDATNAQLEALAALGFRIALDDFGTGYSTFQYLRDLPIQYIKIDGQFVREITTNTVDQAMVKAICDIAKSLGNLTIAEFVEDQATLDLLHEMGVDMAQGFYIGRPEAKIVESKGIKANPRRDRRKTDSDNKSKPA